MMEKSHTRKAHNHIMLIGGFDNEIVAHRATRLAYVTYAAFSRLFDIVGEREKCVAT